MSGGRDDPTTVEIPHGRVVHGRVRVPPSKSISHRYFNLSLLARVATEIVRPLVAQDLELFEHALGLLGVRSRLDGDVLRLEPGEPASTSAEIFCGNAGTMARFLSASLTTLDGEWIVTGTPRLLERPLGPLVEALRNLGADIECLDRQGYAPLRIRGGSLEGGRTAIDASQSSQFLSALLMAATRARRATEIEVTSLSSSPYLDLTLDAIELFGGAVERRGSDVFIVRPTELRPPRLVVEGDYSAATYPAAAALLTGGRVLLEGLDEASKQGDRRFFDLLAAIGAELRWTADGLEVSGSIGSSLEVSLGDMPDQVPTLAALAPFLDGTTKITEVGHLRLKESDRLAVMARELTRAGASVEELADGLVIEGGWSRDEPPSTPIRVDPQDDHRIAMSMALVGLRRPGVTIGDPQVVEKSYPDFWRHLEEILH